MSVCNSNVQCPIGNLNVLVKDGDGKPIQGAKVRILETGQTGVTDANGAFDFGGLLEGNHTCEASKDKYAPNPASEIGYVTPNTTSTVVLTLARVKVVKVLPDQRHKQYVNLLQDQRKHHGNQLVIEAHVQPKKKGIRVYFNVFHETNNRTPRPTPITKLSTDSALTNANGVARTTLEFGRYGGDKFQVGARLDKSKNPKVFSGWFQIWRKIYYEITQMKKPSGGGYWQMAPGAMGQVKTAMGKVFIEMAQLGSTRNANDNVQNFLTARKAYKWADKYCTAHGVPWKIHYAVVGFATKKSGKQANATVTTASQRIGPKFRPFDFDGTDPIVWAQYRLAVGYFGSDVGWMDFPAGNVTLAPVGSGALKQIRVDFAGTGVNPTVHLPQRVRVKYLRHTKNTAGWGGTSLHLVICRGVFDENSAPAQLTAQMASTCIHEPGHSLGLVYGQNWETTDREHSNHCKFPQCVMWWQNTKNRPHDFHLPAKSDPGCHTYIRGLDMSKAKMNKRWKFPR